MSVTALAFQTLVVYLVPQELNTNNCSKRAASMSPFFIV